jgi:hypothetical protein
VVGAYIGKPSMNSCQCNGPNPSEQRREVLASAKAGGKEGGGGIMSDYGDITTVARYAVKHAPLPRQEYYNQNDGLRAK